MSTIASQITSLTIVYSTVYSGTDQRKHQSSASLAFVQGIHRGPVNSPHKGPVTRKMFPFDDVIMWRRQTIDESAIACVVTTLNECFRYGNNTIGSRPNLEKCRGIWGENTVNPNFPGNEMRFLQIYLTSMQVLIDTLSNLCDTLFYRSVAWQNL